MSRKEKRKVVKKLKRKQLRQQAASEGDVALDEDELLRQQKLEEEVLAKERADHEEQERQWLLREEEARQEWLRKQQEETERKLKQDDGARKEAEGAEELEEGWEYVEDGPAEIIWQGNEIIVRKPKRKVRKGTDTPTPALEDKNRPTSNPLPPQSTAFSTHQLIAQDGAEQPSNFGTEQDKRNCPFYIKTGVCRFGVRCSRMHPVFNDKACTLLMRSMYNGAGLALEHVEALEYTDEEVAQEYEEFYEDVHPEFLQFGEIVNFKVCRNGSPHLRGNVYVHFVSQESAMAAHNAINGRFYAKKQISCEFVGVTNWRAAICGEYLRANYKACSHGTACNFMHCFENPRGEYEWADWDRPPPRYWQKKIAKLFGHARDPDDDHDGKQRRERGRGEITHAYDRKKDRSMRESMYDNDRRHDRHWRETTHDDEDDRRHGGHWRESTHHDDNDDHYSRGDSSSRDCDGHRSHHSHHSSRRSRSHDSHRYRRSRSRDRLSSHRSRSRDRHYSSGEEPEDRTPSTQRDGEGRRTPSAKEDRCHRQLVADDSDGGDDSSRSDLQTIERRVGEEKSHKHRHRHSSRDRRNSSDHEHRHRHRHRHKTLESDDERSHRSRRKKEKPPQTEWDVATDHVEKHAGTVSEAANDGGKKLENHPEYEVRTDKKIQGETNSEPSSAKTGLSLSLATDAVQQSTAKWRSWTRAKSKRSRQATKEVV